MASILKRKPGEVTLDLFCKITCTDTDAELLSTATATSTTNTCGTGVDRYEETG